MISYDSVASSCATPSLVKVFLTLSAVAAIINFSVSMWQTTYVDDGDLADMFGMDSWESYCNGDENFDATVIYLRPVAFDWELGNEKGTAFCPWPVTNSAYRGVVTILSFFVAIALLFPSVLSNFGPTTVHVFAVLYFSIFTLDANSLTLGNGSCEDQSTDLIDGIASATTGEVTCQPGIFVFTLFLDIACAALFMWAGSLWRRVGDIYGLGGRK